MKKRLIAFLIALVILLGAIPAFADAPTIEKTRYKGKGRVEVDFVGRVQYKKTKVAVADEDGNAYKVRIKDKDSDDIEFTVQNIKPGKDYTYTISGVRVRKTSGYGSVSGAFSVPEATPVKTPAIQEIEWDAGDRELSIDFDMRVQFKGLKVRVSDENNKAYTVKILEKDRDGVEVRVKGLKRGERYSVRVSGVRAYGEGSYITRTKTFRAVDDD